VLFQFRSPGTVPTRATLKDRFGFEEADLDPEFGFVLIDDRGDVYVTQVDDACRERIAARLPREDPVTGFFGDPRVEPLS